jgi:hypothetical protein
LQAVLLSTINTSTKKTAILLRINLLYRPGLLEAGLKKAGQP